MALSRPLFVGFSSATRVARFQLGNLEVRFYDEASKRWRVFVLTEEMLRIIDLNLERWRREEHEARLLVMNHGELGRTLWQASEAGRLRDVTFLLARGAEVNYADLGHYWSALDVAAFNGHLPVVTLLLEEGVSASDDTALYLAAGGGHMAVATLLLDRCADVRSSGGLSLRAAAVSGHLPMVRLLLDRGADASRDLYADTLPVARQRGHMAVVALLLERGATEYDSDIE